jgi:hypothetical protein
MISDIQRVTVSQVAFGKRLGLDLEGDTVGVALAKIADEIEREFWGHNDLGSPTSRQIELAEKFGADISMLSRGVGNAVIDDLMTRLNMDSVRQQKLAPGVAVRRKHDLIGRVYVVSSIKDDGTVYFRGGNGQRVWSRNLERAV